MKSISLKLQEGIFEETDSLLESLQISRNKYINEAIAFYNDYQKRKLLEETLRKESAIVAKDSMAVLEEFEAITDHEI
jgi:hypothetical protein